MGTLGGKGLMNPITAVTIYYFFVYAKDDHSALRNAQARGTVVCGIFTAYNKR